MKNSKHIPATAGKIMQCGYRVRLKAEVDDVWWAVSRIGGQTGYYYADGKI